MKYILPLIIMFGLLIGWAFYMRKLERIREWQKQITTLTKVSQYAFTTANTISIQLTPAMLQVGTSAKTLTTALVSYPGDDPCRSKE